MSLNIKAIQVQINNLKAQQSKSLNNKTLSKLPEQEQLAFCRRNKELGTLYYQGYLLLIEQKKYLEAALYFDDALILNNQKAFDIAKKNTSSQSGITLAKSELTLPDSELYVSGLCYYYGIGKSCNYNNAFVLIKNAAEQSYARAQYSLGWMYSEGVGKKQNKALAVKWYRKAAEQGHARAQLDLGCMYDNGKGIKQDKSLAVKWYRRAAEQGYAKAQYNLGCMYDNGKGIKKDISLAVKWYRKAAEQGYASAQNDLGWMYEKGEGIKQDKSLAAKWYRKAAEQGYARAQTNLGVIYDNGEGVKQDKAHAVKWYRRAAEQGYARAQCNLGWMYDNGKGVKQDKSLAVKWYRKAAEQGYAIAQYNLGWMYENGEGVKHDKAHAVKWYRKAAEQGDASAQNNLGSMYKNGDGVKQDKALAAKWYRKAAEQENEEAQDSLGCMYYYGEGVQQDKAHAVKWYRKAAKQGFAVAQYNLGWMYSYGEGVKQSKQIAARWFRLAAEQGNSDGKFALNNSDNIFMQYHSGALGADAEKIKKLIHKHPILIKELIHDLSRVNENSTLFNLMTSLIEPVLNSKPWPKRKALMRKLQFRYLKVMYQNISVDTIHNEQYITKVINQLSDLNLQGLKAPQIKERLQLVSDFYFLIQERASISTHLAFKQVALIAIKRCLYQLNANQTSPANDGDDMHLLRQCASILIKALFGEEYEINFTITPRFNQLLGLLGLYQANPNLTPAQVNGMLAVNLIKPTQFKCGVEFIKAFQSYLNQETINNKSTAVTSLKSQLTGLLNKTENLTDENTRVILDKLQAYAKDVLKKSALNPNGFFKIKGNDKELLECISNQQYDFLIKYFNEMSAKHDVIIQNNNPLKSISR